MRHTDWDRVGHSAARCWRFCPGTDIHSPFSSQYKHIDCIPSCCGFWSYSDVVVAIPCPPTPFSWFRKALFVTTGEVRYSISSRSHSQFWDSEGQSSTMMLLPLIFPILKLDSGLLNKDVFTPLNRQNQDISRSLFHQWLSLGHVHYLWQSKRISQVPHIICTLRSDLLHYDSKCYPVYFLQVFCCKFALQLGESDELAVSHLPVHFCRRHPGFPGSSESMQKRTSLLT